MCRPHRELALAAVALLAACSQPARNGDAEGRAPAAGTDAAPAPDPAKEPVMPAPSASAPIEFEATVSEFKPNAMRDQYDDGSFAVFHLSRLQLTSPAHLAGRELRIYHDREVAADSPWRQTGARIRFRAREADVIDKPGQVFAGAVSDVRGAD